MTSLPGYFATEMLQNLLIKCGLYPTSIYGVLRIRSHEVRSLSGAFRYQMMISLPGCFATEMLQNLLIKCGLYPTSIYSVLRIRSHEVRSLSGAYMSTTCPWGCFSVLCRTGQRFLLAFLGHAMRCDILRSKCLQPRHLLGMLGIRYHRVIPLHGCFGYRLSVRLLEAAKSVQRTCYTDLSRLCTVGSVLYRRRPHSMPLEPQRRYRAV
jgi:hypothetical protein